MVVKILQVKVVSTHQLWYITSLFSYADLKKILELNPPNDQARKAIQRLEPLAAEKREKMKEEAITKLKEMGNSILGRFGMSVDNFKAVSDRVVKEENGNVKLECPPINKQFSAKA
ncbi:hypothetical protein HID58_040705 [Brassica napus]|uniref:Uncharacterized protein n=1 Tax=Brassica napus TaxID=3708 RepID=A0ABQ8B8T3_BRANA|nr:hypothetical protein HID58_040705 [Brassica napus]